MSSDQALANPAVVRTEENVLSWLMLNPANELEQGKCTSWGLYEQIGTRHWGEPQANGFEPGKPRKLKIESLLLERSAKRPHQWAFIGEICTPDDSPWLLERVQR